MARDYGSGENRRPVVRSEYDLEKSVRSTLRRLGHVVAMVHTVVMSQLIKAGKQEQAEELNNWMKPLADLLLNYEGELPFRGDDEEV